MYINSFLSILIALTAYATVIILVFTGKGKKYRFQRIYAKALTSVIVSYILLSVFIFILLTPTYASFTAATILFISSLMLPPFSWFLVIKYWSEE
ncbi:MAG: hypothetical protein DRN04_00100 [Thermoprotei archaeon]|nr:MAG: hypothetical protein DRN04_00100 [Thermoprotei archaeon]